MSEFATQTMKDLKGYLNPDQVEKLIAAAPSGRDRLLLQIMYRCGRRVSEVLAMRKGDILWDEGKIIFNILKRKRPTKEMKPVDSETMELLKKYVSGGGTVAPGNPGGEWLRKGMESDEDGRLFPVSRQYVFKMLRNTGKSVGIERVGKKGLHPHHFRHSFAVYEVKNNIRTADDLRKLQMYMGHANLSTTAHYLQFSPDELRDLVDGSSWNRKKPQVMQAQAQPQAAQQIPQPPAPSQTANQQASAPAPVQPPAATPVQQAEAVAAKKPEIPVPDA
jgi:integrase/recombinase XerD